MPSILALLHTENDALRLGRCLETLYACDHILVVDHGSRDRTLQIAREYGARIVGGMLGASHSQYVQSALPSALAGWILCLDPRESLTEGLAASLFEWKSGSGVALVPCSVYLREETAEGWIEHPAAQTRLVPATWNLWHGNFPADAPAASTLEGELLRFVFP